MCSNFRCVYPGCNKTWVDEAANSVSHSHGLCPEHARLKFIETFRLQQRKEGYWPCAGMSTELCDKTACTYWPVCVNPTPILTDYLEVERRQMVRRAVIYGHPRDYRFEAMAAG